MRGVWVLVVLRDFNSKGSLVFPRDLIFGPSFYIGLLRFLLKSAHQDLLVNSAQQGWFARAVEIVGMKRGNAVQIRVQRYIFTL